MVKVKNIKKIMEINVTIINTNQILHYIFHFIILLSLISIIIIAFYLYIRTKKEQKKDKKIKKTFWEKIYQKQPKFADEFIKKYIIGIFSSENKLFIYIFFIFLFIITIISMLLGVISTYYLRIGLTASVALGTLLMALTTYYSIIKGDKKEDDKEKNRFLILLLSIRTELSVLMKREKDLIGDIIEKTKEEDGAPFGIGLLKPNHAYFTVYDNSSYELIGLIGRNNKELAEKVTKAYLIAKSYYDELIYYPEIWDKYVNENTKEGFENYRNHVHTDIETGVSYAKKSIGAIYNYYWYVLKRDRDTLIPLVEEVIKEIDEILEESNRTTNL